MSGDNRGFTIIEVVVALLILSVGILALAGTSGTVTRMIGNGARTTRAAAAGAQRIETLRRVANSTSPRCGALANGSVAAAGGVGESWSIATVGDLRQVTVVVTSVNQRGTTRDTLRTLISCE